MIKEEKKLKNVFFCDRPNLRATTGGDNGSKLVILLIWQTCNTCKLSRRVKAIIFARERNKSCPLHQFCWHILAKWRKNKNGQGGLFWPAISANVHQFDFGMAASLYKWYKGMDTKHSESKIWTDIKCIESVRNVILLEKLLINGPS